MRTVPQPCGWFSVEGLASKRNSHPLTQHVGVPAPSLHGRYPLLRYYAPVRLPDEAAPGLCIPLGRWPPRAGPLRGVSQVPGLLISLHALSPTTPESPVAALAPYFTTGGRLHPRLGDWPLSLCVTRPNRVRLRYGSRIRSARLRSADRSAPRWLGYLLNGQLQGKLLSAYKISQAAPGAPDGRFLASAPAGPSTYCLRT
jgi:hypothetical protein